MAFRNPLTSNPITSFPASGLTGFIQGSQLAADAIDGKVITGATIRTAASGLHWVMDSGIQDEIRGYTGDSHETSPGLLGISQGFGQISAFLWSPQTTAGGLALLDLVSQYNSGQSIATLQATGINLFGNVNVSGTLNVGGVPVVGSGQTQGGSISLGVIAAGGSSGTITVYFGTSFPGLPTVVGTTGSGRLTASVSYISYGYAQFVVNNWSPGANIATQLYWIATY